MSYLQILLRLKLILLSEACHEKLIQSKSEDITETVKTLLCNSLIDNDQGT